MRGTRVRRVVDTIVRFPFDARTRFAGLLALIGYCAYQAATLRSNFAEWDWREISAFALLLVMIRIAMGIDDSLSRTLHRLCVCGVIACSEDEFGRLSRTLALHRRRWPPVWGGAIGIAVIVAFAVGWQWLTFSEGWPWKTLAMSWSWKTVIDDRWRLALLAVEAPGCYVAGYYIGWMVVQGRLARVLRTLDIRYSVQPGHPDGAAGLRPLGDFFFRQALLAGSVSGLVASTLPFSRGGTCYREALLALASDLRVHRSRGIRVAHVGVPSRDGAPEALSRSANGRHRPQDLQHPKGTPQPHPFDTRRELHARLALDLKLYEELEGLPTWPVSKQIRRRFALQNLVFLALPVLGLLTGDKWSQVLRFLQGLSSAG